MYYIIKDGKPVGPLTLDELSELSPKGTDFVKPKEADDYKELREWPKLCTLLGINYEPALPQYYASLDIRLLATAIDYFFAFVIYGVVALTLLIKLEKPEERLSYIGLGLVLIPVIKFLLNVVCEGSNKNASPGKMLLQIRVTDDKGNPISFGRALWRNLAKISGLLTLGLGFIAGFFDRKQRCFHDKLARTLVIKDRLI